MQRHIVIVEDRSWSCSCRPGAWNWCRTEIRAEREAQHHIEWPGHEWWPRLLSYAYVLLLLSILLFLAVRFL